MDFNEFAAWEGTRIAAGKLVEAITASGGLRHILGSYEMRNHSEVRIQRYSAFR